MNIEQQLVSEFITSIKSCYGAEVNSQAVQIQKTKAEFEGEYTFVVFPLLRTSKKSPEVTAQELGENLTNNSGFVKGYNVVKGFLNLSLNDEIWLNTLLNLSDDKNIKNDDVQNIMVEYSSPNSNKPLHLGHLRNNFLGYSVAEILKANGHKVIKTQIINDRGVHICKSMLAWQKYANGATPESTGIKGDHFVGDYYVMFDKYYKLEMQVLTDKGMSKEEAMQEAPLFKEAGAMLRAWEQNDKDVVALWKEMNSWVYDGFKHTYKTMGVDFDKLYYESDTYKLGKNIVEEGIHKGIFHKREDGSVWCDLTSDGLDEKLVLRKDGTSVYMTQDIGTAVERYNDYKINGMIYTVADEQNYHFKVLFLILKKLGYNFYEGLYHLSYGMIDLPSGRMKTREGTVVDADEIMQEMVDTATKATEEKGKTEGFTADEIKEINTNVGMSALKYFLLKVDPRKGMIFNPEESIDFNGNTGPFILFNYVRTKSILAKNDAPADVSKIKNVDLSEKEIQLIFKLNEYPKVLALAAKDYSPAVVANYCYELAKDYSQFYAASPILNEENEAVKQMRLLLSEKLGTTIKNGMSLLGCDMVDRM
ncbi:MAG: arginyl-tRNA synthetase [Saprospiraceae bacterium]|jgi:arginyl-tRNA synthetase